MPTTWKKTPQDFHKLYINNTEAFYRASSPSLAGDLDRFVTSCAFGLWGFAPSLTQEQVDMANQIYSKGQPQPSWLLWSMTEKVCKKEPFFPPIFFFDLAESDAKHNTDNSRIFVRMTTVFLLYLAACDDDVNLEEARYITDITDKLTAICDSSGVKKSKQGLDPMEYITTDEKSFLEKNTVRENTAGGTAQQPRVQPKEPPKKSMDELLEELEGLVGLEDIKRDVKSLVNLVKVRKLRQANDLPVPPISLHMVFVGNPGTGKTTVARLMGQLYAAAGALTKGQLIETDRSGLVAGYVGQTALKTQQLIQSALGGVLFIDEAYSLSSGGENDFGREAIETLLKGMEDNRDNLVVIVAGYTEPMRKFLSSNPGLESRFNKYFFFPDYNGDQLMEIFRMQCRENGYTLTKEAEKKAVSGFRKLYKDRGENFGNGRDVRNRFEDMVAAQSNRVAAMKDPSKEELMSVLPEDIDIA